jgi:DNA-directed RNA polymerase specialized sigma24 family protein
VSDPLERVRRAAASRRRADESYRAAILDAFDSGLSLGTIAKAAGVKRQAVQQHLKRMGVR